jgi:hypothetical protein
MKEAQEIIAYLLQACAMKDAQIAQLQAALKSLQGTQAQPQPTSATSSK